jgi:hypothetical protein
MKLTKSSLIYGYKCKGGCCHSVIGSKFILFAAYSGKHDFNVDDKFWDEFIRYDYVENRMSKLDVGETFVFNKRVGPPKGKYTKFIYIYLKRVE